MHPTRSLLPLATGFLVAFVLAAGCSKKTTAPPAPTDLAPAATSPEAALRRLQWGWNHLDPAVLRSVFTEDFVFKFGATDSTGQGYRDGLFLREDELASNQHLFVGGCSEPPAISIRLTFDPTLHVTGDTRPGRDPAFHRAILTTVALTVRTESRTYESQGRAQFFFTRGDSASIPPDLVRLGYHPDPNQWWIDRWEDETIGGGALATYQPMPANTRTWGQLKALYR